ncbi:sugar ABC transporter permease [Marispirochaeta aestuarii]|uniref:carbohydrate ABC transporter permease n=1 Tax=Marispirochaeta aestuarii TaxID=1963862 RepID=UPI0029C952BE|nr:sugar ABC transporter permease [Marispirochaeta aestuarii]
MQSYFHNKRLPYLLLLPTFIILIVFLFYPAIETFRLSFYKVHPFGLKKIFAGLHNFINLFSDEVYIKSFITSVVFSIAVVLAGLSISLLIALMLNQDIKGIKIYRTLLIWPYALSPAISGAIFRFLFNPANGYMNHFFQIATGMNAEWLTNSTLAILVVTVAATWKNLGYNIIFYLTGLRNVQKEAIESAAIDGAGSVKRFIYITFPMLSPTTFFLLIMNIIYSYFQSFGLIDVLTEGGPANSTNILIYQLYRDFFVNAKTGYAAAESLILFTLVVFLTLIQFKTTGRKVYYQ